MQLADRDREHGTTGFRATAVGTLNRRAASALPAGRASVLRYYYYPDVARQLLGAGGRVANLRSLPLWRSVVYCLNDVVVTDDIPVRGRRMDGYWWALLPVIAHYWCRWPVAGRFRGLIIFLCSAYR
jgi:hypothetical protein